MNDPASPSVALPEAALDRYCPFVKIFGERNTGTNFVEALLTRNFAVHCLTGRIQILPYSDAMAMAMPTGQRGPFRSRMLDLDCARMAISDFGWKHGVPPFDIIRHAPHARHTLFIAVAKHPVAWVASLLRRPYNPVEPTPKAMPAFLDYQWKLTARDNLPGHDRIGVVELWNEKNAVLQRLKDVAARSIFIRYESLLADPAAFLGAAAKHLLPRGGEFVWSLPSTKESELDFEGYRRKYAPENADAIMDAAYRARVMERADPSVLAQWGYA